MVRGRDARGPRPPAPCHSRVVLRPGDVLGRYEILGPLGAGGMASVYAARVRGEADFAKLVAVKVMLPHLSRDPRFEKMFADEARLASRIESAHVVGTLDLGRNPDAGLYQVLDLVLGASLRQLSDAAPEPPPLPVALAVLAQAAKGLSDAHAARAADGTPLGLVHRDVSPHNLLVGVDGRARLSDFGVARAVARASGTESGELKGKLGYASPEQLGGQPLDARSDVFSLGIVAWETIAGGRLFDADNPLALVEKLVHQPIPPLDAARPEVPGPLAALVARMLERDRDARIASAAEVAAELEAIARAHALTATPADVAAFVRTRGGAPLEALERELERRLSAPPTAADRARTPRPRSNVGGWIAGAVIVAGGAAWWLAGALGTAEPRAPEAEGTTRGAIAAALEGRDDAEGAEGEPAAPAATRAAADAGREVDAGAAADAGAATEASAASAPPATRRLRREERPRTEETPPVATEDPLAPASPPAPRGGLLGVEEFDRE